MLCRQDGYIHAGADLRCKSALTLTKERYPSDWGYYLKTSMPAIPWGQKILKTFDYLNANVELDLNEIIGKRNDIIHANSTLKGKLEISNQEIINLFNTVYNGLKMI